jgi:hypothetical protein
MPAPAAPAVPVTKHTGEPRWAIRRLIVLPTVVWAAWEVHTVINDPTTEPDTKKMLAKYLVYLLAFCVATFSGLATIQDIIAIWRTGTGRPYAVPAVSVAADSAPPPPADGGAQQ